MKTTISYFFAIVFLASCAGSKSKVESQKIEDFAKPIATFMNATSGAQLFSYFSQPTAQKDKVTLNADFCSTGSSGKNPAIFVCDFAVDSVPFKSFIMVSQEDLDKVKEALKKKEEELKKDDVSLHVTFEGKIDPDGSYKSPFGGEISLKFTEGKVVAID